MCVGVLPTYISMYHAKSSGVKGIGGFCHHVDGRNKPESSIKASRDLNH